MSQISQKRWIWVILLLELKEWGLGTPYPIVKGNNIVIAFIVGHIGYLGIITFGLEWVRPPIIPKKRM